MVPLRRCIRIFGKTADSAWLNKACASLFESGPRLAAVRAHLADRAALLGRAISGVLEISLEGAGSVSAIVPADAHTVRLVSASCRVGGDRRLLGALVTGLSIDGAAVALDDGWLVRGFHDVEHHDGKAVRWTDGAGVVRLNPASDARSIEIEVAAVSAEVVEQRAA
jgi:hypothetical protein